LPGKNLRKLGAMSLIGHAVASAREARRISRFIVSTDSGAIAEEARRHGAEVPFLRPAELASDGPARR
jgi:CMP-N-acetylneuraminic acid synthetase